MIKTITLGPGILLRCFPDERFKQGCLSLQMIRPMREDEAALNALIPAVLLRGTKTTRDLREITLRLDDLYGASVGALVRRVGDYQTTGLHCSFIDDRYAMEGDAVLAPMADFLGEMLLDPVLDKGVFPADYVESEKKNLISTIESQRNDKRIYAAGRLLRLMCAEDSFGIPRLGEAEAVKTITPAQAYEHYVRILRESRMEIFYVGAAEPETVAGCFAPVIGRLNRNYVNLPEQTAFRGAPAGDHRETLDVAQGRLNMGFVTPISLRSGEFVAMQVFNTLFGGGMTSKLFMNVREKMSLCYDVGSGYHGAKGIMTVSAGIDCKMEQTAREEILRQLDACRRGQITPEELNAAKQAVCSSLRAVHDAPGAIENYYATAALSGLDMTPAEYMEKVEQVTLSQVVAAANSLTLHTTYFLEGVQ